MPNDKAYQNNLLTDRKGFEMALASVYTNLIANSLYGVEMKYGFLESLVGSYNPVNSSSHVYYRPYRHEYNHTTSEKFIEEIWSDLYKTINELNLILEKIENIENDRYYNLVKGEAIGLRAFCHFELLKLFGPVIVEEGLGSTAIPYRSAVVYEGTKFSTASEVIQLLQKDLEEAKSLLEEDQIRTVGRTADQNTFDYEQYNSLIDRRGTRMNYYAVVALQSLVAQWGGEKENAAKYAEELIAELKANSVIRMALPSELTSALNKRLPMESILSFIDQDFRTEVIKVLPIIGNPNSASTSPLLFPNYNWLGTSLYNSTAHGSTSDFRYKPGVWFQEDNEMSSRPYKLVKYHFDENYTLKSNAQLFEINILSLHRMYMVAAEYYAERDPQKAIDYLNLVRNARDIITNLQYSSSMTEELIKGFIFDELRKENIGEGMLFAEYKRLYKAIDRENAVQPSLERFKLPIPVNELMYNPQEN